MSVNHWNTADLSTVQWALSESSSWLQIFLRFNGHFPGEPGLANFIRAKDNGSGGDNWSYKKYKNSSQIITTNKPTPTFLQTKPFQSQTRPSSYS